MVEVQDKTSRLPWDSFIEREAAVSANPEQTARMLRMHIDRFREAEWPNIKRELGKEPYNWVLPEGLEPHWVGPGKVAFWQERIVRERVEKVVDGAKALVVEEVSYGWHPVGSGLPANNPSVIAGYLNKGFRFRPPQAGVAQETLQSVFSLEALELIEHPELDDEIEWKYQCSRHGPKIRKFASWANYIAHCAFYRETVEDDPPEEILARAKSFPYYCYLHDQGFEHWKMAHRHMKTELQRGGRAIHPTVDQMKIIPKLKKEVPKPPEPVQETLAEKKEPNASESGPEQGQEENQ